MSEPSDSDNAAAALLWLHAVPLDSGTEPEWMQAFVELLPKPKVEIIDGTIDVDVTELVLSAWTAITVAVQVGAGLAGYTVPAFIDLLTEAHSDG